MSFTVISLISGSTAVHLTVIVMMAVVVLLIAKIPFWYYLKIMSLAFVFIFFGSAAIAFNSMDFHEALCVFLRAAAAVSCFYFLILTTPVADTLSVLRKIRVPLVIVELMGLTYRFIFVFMDIMQKTHTAQASRLGYSTLKRAYRSAGILISNLFARMFRHADNLNTALQSRGFTGELRIMQRQFNFSAVNIVVITVSDVVLIAVGNLCSR